MSNVPNYTNELLAKNFNYVADGFNSMGLALDVHQDMINHLEGHVVDLSKQVAKLAAKAPKQNSKVFLISLVAASVYVGYKYCEFEIEGRVERPADLANKAAANAKTAADNTKAFVNEMKDQNSQDS